MYSLAVILQAFVFLCALAARVDSLMETTVIWRTALGGDYSQKSILGSIMLSTLLYHPLRLRVNANRKKITGIVSDDVQCVIVSRNITHWAIECQRTL